MEMSEAALREFIASLDENVTASGVETALREFCRSPYRAPDHRDVWSVGSMEQRLYGCTTRDEVHRRLTSYFGTQSTEAVKDFVRTTRFALTDKYNVRVLPALADIDYDTTDETAIMQAMRDAAYSAFRDTKAQVANIGEIKPPRVTATTIDYEQRVMPKVSDATHPLHIAAIVDAEDVINDAMDEFEDGVCEDHLLEPNTTILFKRTINGPSFRALENAAKSLAEPTRRVSRAWREQQKKRKRDEEDPEVTLRRIRRERDALARFIDRCGQKMEDGLVRFFDAEIQALVEKCNARAATE